MLATEWLSDVSQCLAETLEAGKIDLYYVGNKLLLRMIRYGKRLNILTMNDFILLSLKIYFVGELDETEDVGISLVEELLTDFLQLIHGTIRNLIPVETSSTESDDENERAAQNTIG